MRGMDIDTLQRRLRATLPMARLDCRPLPGCPEISLALINDDFPLGPLPPDVMRAVIARPAYWSLCWGSGLALARHLLDHTQRDATTPCQKRLGLRRDCIGDPTR